jgi:hypothetical protein
MNVSNNFMILDLNIGYKSESDGGNNGKIQLISSFLSPPVFNSTLKLFLIKKAESITLFD